MIQNERSIASGKDVKRHSQDSLGTRSKVNMLGAAYGFSTGCNGKILSEIITHYLRDKFIQHDTYPVEPLTMEELNTRALFQFDKQDPDRMTKISKYCILTFAKSSNFDLYV